MILHRQTINHKHRVLRIRPFGDLQMGEKGFREDLWERWKREALEDKGSLIIGMGDYSDSFRTTINKKLQKVFVDDNEAHLEMDDKIMKEMQGIAKELEPFRHRIIGLHTGHHKFDFLGGGNSDIYLCQLLKVKYLDFFAGTQLIWHRGLPETSGGNKIINILSTHGCGGAKYVHSDMAKFNDLVYSWDADVYIRGHSTKAYCVNYNPLNRFPKSATQPMRIMAKQRLIVNTGGFMDGYAENHSSYVEQANMPPAALGFSVIELHINAKTDLEIKGYSIVG